MGYAVYKTAPTKAVVKHNGKTVAIINEAKKTIHTDKSNGASKNKNKNFLTWFNSGQGKTAKWLRGTYKMTGKD